MGAGDEMNRALRAAAGRLPAEPETLAPEPDAAAPVPDFDGGARPLPPGPGPSMGDVLAAEYDRLRGLSTFHDGTIRGRGA